MSCSWFQRLIPAAIAIAGAIQCWSEPAGQPDAVLVEMADLHSAYDRLPQLLAQVDQVFAGHPGVPHAVLIDGDIFEAGNAVGRRSHGLIELEFLRALARRGPTLCNLGNHESEFFGMAEAVSRIRAAGVVVVGGTVRDRATGRPFVPATIAWPLGGQTVRVVAFATDRLTTFRAAVRPTLALDDPVDWAKRNLPTMFRDAPIRVVLSHAGLAADRRILPLVPDGTLFVGAHDHLRLVQTFGRTVYFQAGSWGATYAVIELRTQPEVNWTVALEAVPADGPEDRALARVVAKTLAQELTPEETVVLGRLAAPLDPDAAARFATDAARRATHADAAVIGATTFGAGLPGGNITRYQLDACVRFDGPLFVGAISGAELAQLSARSNQGPATPFAARSGENLILTGPTEIDPARTYRIATTDWIASKPEPYFGTAVPRLTPAPGLRLKAAVAAALLPPK